MAGTDRPGTAGRSRASYRLRGSSEPARAVRRRAAARSAVIRGGIRPARARSDDAGRAGGRRQSRRAARSARRRRSARSTRRTPTNSARPCDDCIDDEAFAAACAAKGVDPRARVQMGSDRPPGFHRIRVRHAPPPHAMRIGIDARELCGRPPASAGISRASSENGRLMRERHEFVLYTAAPLTIDGRRSSDSRHDSSRAPAARGGNRFGCRRQQPGIIWTCSSRLPTPRRSA